MLDSFLRLVSWNATVTAVLAVLVMGACCLSLVRRRPALRHGLWLLVLIKLVTPPLIPIPILTSRSEAEQPALPSPSSQPAVAIARERTGSGESSARPATDERTAGPPPADVASATSAPATAVPASPTSSSTPGSSAASDEQGRSAGVVAPRLANIPWLKYVLFVWGGGAVFLLIRRGFRGRRLQGLLQRSDVCDGRLQEIVERAASSMGLAGVTVRMVDARLTPFVWIRGRAPVIVFPRALVTQLDDEQIRSIACHELAHHVRRDLRTNAFAYLITAAFWWHPAAWLARREIRKAQELCCDELAISSCQVNRKTYLQTLFQALEFVNSGALTVSWPASGFGDSRSLKARFQALADGRLVPRNSWRTTAVLATIFPALLCLPVVGRTGDKGKKAPPATAKKPRVDTDNKKSSKNKPGKASLPAVDFGWPDVTSVAFSDDSRWLLTASSRHGRLELWDLATRKKKTLGNGKPGDILALAFLRDGKQAVTTSRDGTARVWDLVGGKPVGPPMQLAGPAKAIAISPDGTTLLTGDTDGSVQLWDLKKRSKGSFSVQLPGAANAVAFSPDGKSMVVACQDKTARIWKKNGRVVAILKHDSPVVSLDHRYDGKLLATSCVDGTVQVWNPATGAAEGESRKPKETAHDVVFYSDTGGPPEPYLIVVTGKASYYRRAKTGRVVMVLRHQTSIQAVAFGRFMSTRGSGKMKHLKTLMSWK